MALRREKLYTFYPEYFDSNLSRAEGRRIPLRDPLDNKRLAIKAPRAKELHIAATRSQLEVTLNETAAYPRRWWENRGSISVKPMESKTQTQMKLARSLRDLRIELLRKKKEMLDQKKKKPKSGQKRRS